MRPWRNWYTRSTKDAVGQPLGVRFPLVAPKFQASAARIEILNIQTDFANFILARIFINLLT